MTLQNETLILTEIFKNLTEFADFDRNFDQNWSVGKMLVEILF